MPAPSVPDSAQETFYRKERGCLNGTWVALAKANRTADTYSNMFMNPGAKGAYVIIDADTVAAQEDFTFNILMRDPTDGSTNTIYTAPAAISAAGEYVYLFYPASIEDPVANGGAFADEVQIPLPRYFQVLMDHSSTGTHNYSCSFSFIP